MAAGPLARGGALGRSFGLLVREVREVREDLRETRPKRWAGGGLGAAPPRAEASRDRFDERKILREIPARIAPPRRDLAIRRGLGSNGVREPPEGSTQKRSMQSSPYRLLRLRPREQWRYRGDDFSKSTS